MNKLLVRYENDETTLQLLLRSMCDLCNIQSVRGFIRERPDYPKSYASVFKSSGSPPRISHEVLCDILESIFEINVLSFSSDLPNDDDKVKRTEEIVASYGVICDMATAIPGLKLKHIRQVFREFVLQLNDDRYNATFNSAVACCFPLGSNKCSRYFSILSVLVTTENSSKPYDILLPMLTTAYTCTEMKPDALRQFSLLVCSLVLDGAQISSAHGFVSILEFLETVVKEKPGYISPFLFIQILSFLITSTSHNGPRFQDSFDMEDVYMCVCSLSSALFLHCYKFLRGRHHLAIHLLQNLLYGLCVANGGRRPYWKRASWMSSNKACSATCALSYARLLSNFSEPSFSAGHVRGNKRSGSSAFGLSSKASASRRALSKHAPYLIIEFCFATLTHKFNSEDDSSTTSGGGSTREIVTRAMYTMFDLLGQNELQIANAAVDSAGRAIYKRLYNDYLQFGKWKEST
ncbi:Urb2/Npa2 family-domain-containing protein [Limtongia smithiae]|uniref:Urb2/Npa2 family-domain-containing protein n=1 Tax=Limtongia smithiae TaxID=1125753 RepID=UPI0034CEF90F